MSNLCNLLPLISAHATFVGPMYFLKNEIEGRAELASYLEDKQNIARLNRFFSEHNIFDKKVTECIYGSIGSSSSQIFVPSTLDQITNANVVHIDIGAEKWSVVLVPDNVVDSKYIVFDILHELYEKTNKPIAISNAIAHAFYGKDQTYKNINATSCNFSTTLKELNADIIKLIDNEEKTAKKMNLSVLQGLQRFTTDLTPQIDEFLQNVVVIPRIKTSMTGLTYDQCTVQNGWTSVLTIPGKTLVDIGGGKTNAGFKLDDAGKIIEAVNKELKNKATDIAVLTGQIRSAVEKSESSCTTIKQSSDIVAKPEYREKYFAGVDNNFSYKLTKSTTSNPSGGRRTRRRRRARKTKKSRRKNRRKTRK